MYKNVYTSESQQEFVRGAVRKEQEERWRVEEKESHEEGRQYLEHETQKNARGTDKNVSRGEREEEVRVK